MSAELQEQLCLLQILQLYTRKEAPAIALLTLAESQFRQIFVRLTLLWS